MRSWRPQQRPGPGSGPHSVLPASRRAKKTLSRYLIPEVSAPSKDTERCCGPHIPVGCQVRSPNSPPPDTGRHTHRSGHEAGRWAAPSPSRTPHRHVHKKVRRERAVLPQVGLSSSPTSKSRPVSRPRPQDTVQEETLVATLPLSAGGSSREVTGLVQ